MSLYKHLQDTECIICFKNTTSTSNKKKITYSCGHKYHYTCIQNWLEESGNVIDHCISCNTVREYIISRNISNQKRKKRLKKYKKQKNKQKSQCCMIQ
jgi:hypothetical protein